VHGTALRGVIVPGRGGCRPGSPRQPRAAFVVDRLVGRGDTAGVMASLTVYGAGALGGITDGSS